jgi:hypothetical protein
LSQEQNLPPVSGVPPALVARAERERREIVHGLKAADDLAKQLRLWRAGDLYRASGSPEVVLNLRPNADGSVMGWAQGSDGRFIGQARWIKATTWGSRLVSSTALLAGHVMLVEISAKLDRIEAKVDRVQHALDDDRRQALKAAIGSVDAALTCEPTTARDLLTAAATPLRIAIGQEIQSLSRQIQQTPMPPRSYTKGAIWDNGPETRRDLSEAETSFLAALQGIRALTYLYIGLGENRTAWRSAHDLLLRLSESGLNEAWWKARNLRPDNPQDQPEAFWTRAMGLITEAQTQALAYTQDTLPSLTLSPDDEVKLVLEEAERCPTIADRSAEH